MRIAGILSISNGMGLGYPIPPVVLNLSGLCDTVLVGVDPAYPGDRKVVEAMGLRNVDVFDSPWDRSEKNFGREIAAQMDKLVDIAKDKVDWVVVMQADELIHNDDFLMIREFMKRAPGHVGGFSMERLYFWGALNKVRQDWNARLIRIFRPGYFSFLAENTDKAGMYSGKVKESEVIDLPYYIYHYSRIGSPSDISRRIRNLDGFFHEERDLIPVDKLPDYDFKGREYDNFNLTTPPPEKEAVVVGYEGTHPLGITEWYE